MADRGPSRAAQRAAHRTAVVQDLLADELARRGPDAGPADVLDAGGGSGGFAVPLAVLGHRVTVVDPSPDSLAALERRAAEHGVADRVRAVQGDLDTLLDTTGERSADLVLCHSVLEVVDDPAAALAATARVLRPGGAASLLVAQRTAVVVARALAGRFDDAAALLASPDGTAPGDAVRRRWDADGLAAVVAAAGLRVEQVHGVRVVADLVPGALVDAEPGAADALVALERALSDGTALRDLATQLHLLARA